MGFHGNLYQAILIYDKAYSARIHEFLRTHRKERDLNVLIDQLSEHFREEGTSRPRLKWVDDMESMKRRVVARERDSERCRILFTE